MSNDFETLFNVVQKSENVHLETGRNSTQSIREIALNKIIKIENLTKKQASDASLYAVEDSDEEKILESLSRE